MKRFVIALLILSVVLSLALAWNLKRQNDAQQRPPGSSGVVEGTRVVVASRLASRVIEVKVREGDRVKPGDVMALLDCTEPDAQVQAAEARIAASRAQWEATRSQAGAASLQAKAAKHQAQGQKAQAGSVRVLTRRAERDTERAVTLQKDRVMDDVTVENLKSNVDDLQERIDAANAATAAADMSAAAAEKQALAATDQVTAMERQIRTTEADLLRAKATQSECRIVAPRGGVVVVRAREAGEVVLPGGALFELRDDASLKVKFYVVNGDLGRVKVGMPTAVMADAFAGETFSGKVTRVSEEAEFTPRNMQTRSDRDRLVFAVEAEVDNDSGRLRAGMPVDVAVVEPTKP